MGECSLAEKVESNECAEIESSFDKLVNIITITPIFESLSFSVYCKRTFWLGIYKSLSFCTN